MPAIHDVSTHSGLTITASHDGYRQLPGAPTHTRRVTVSNEHPLLIVDTISGDGAHHLSGGWLLAPEWTAHPAENGWLLKRPGARTIRVRVSTSAAVALSIAEAKYHPEYGQELSTSRLSWNCTGSLPFEITTEVALEH